jgi:diacylglycerol kinase
MAIGTYGSKTRIESLRFASGGLKHAIYNQRNFQIQIIFGLIVIAAAWFLNFSRIEWLILILTIGLVLASELINTVVEVVVDLAVKERLLPDAKIAKDVAAAAVLLTSIFSVIIGLILFVPHFL